MLVVLLKKTDSNTKVAAIDTKISTLDGKITKNESIRKTIILFFWEILCLIKKMVLKLI